MSQYIVKVLLSALVIVAATELSKRSVWAGAVLLALPITTLLALFWLYHDTGDVRQVAALARGVFWLVLPSLALLLAFPWAIERGWGFWRAISFGAAVAIAGYGVLALGFRSLSLRF